MPKAGITHDITIEDHDTSNRRGFMLARDKQGRRGITRKDAETRRPRVLSMGELTQAELPPELELSWFQEDWALGIGGVNHRLDPKRTAVTEFIDASTPGVIRLARALNATTLNGTANSPEPSGFALAQDRSTTDGLDPVLWSFVGQDPYKWSESDGDWDIYNSGTPPQAIDVIYQNGIQFGTNTVVPAWYGAADANESPYFYIYKAIDSDSWVVSNVITTGARMKYMAKGRNSSGDEILWGGNNLSDTGINTNEGALLAADDVTITTHADPRSAIAVNDMILIGPVGSQEIMLVTATATGPNTITVVRGYGTPAVTHTDAAHDIYLYQPHVIRSSTDPTNSGSWTSATTVGVDDQPITGMVFDEDNDILFVTKTDGIYSVTSDGQVRNLTTLFRQAGHPGNFKGSYSWNHHILLPSGYGGLYDFNYGEGTVEDVSIRIAAPEETELHGVVLSMHGDPVNLFALVKDLTAETVYLLLANRVEFEGKTDFRWHVMAKHVATGSNTILDSQCNIMVDTSRENRRRVWVGLSESQGSAVALTPKFMTFGNINDDNKDGYTSTTLGAGVVETTLWDANLPRVDKRIESIELETRNLGVGGRAIKVEYKANQEASWHLLGSANVSPFFPLEFPPGTIAKVLQLKLTLNMTTGGDNAILSPELVSFRVKGQLRPASNPVYSFKVYLADELMLLNGATSRDRAGDLKKLRAWNEASEEVLLGLPNKGTPMKAIFMPGSLSEQEVGNETGRRSEYVVSFDVAWLTPQT